ncbi:hypothetical protein SISNIDRAFT_420935 [Sistotremastrum niveocremeum HHB9708]|uniref:DDE-1 domain-containing protein n=1 Tax=Sistotremastrum niveocremeum HHB9708 TaxID=1314777 RepID=A0A164M6S7_9AGAM|nr:hypothetical protein SISNIDRAFT_420935 [Sistotremastrum niveocremeum HHB9708]
MEPHLFNKYISKTELFRCSDPFVYKFLRLEMKWTLRRTTRAAQKLPDNSAEQCEHTRLRIACHIRDYSTPAQLIVNMDQTQALYVHGSKVTYHDRGAKQVSVAGVEDKRAFTVCVAVSLSGTALPFQAIYQGHIETRVTPGINSPRYEEAIRLGLKFVASKTDTYWANFGTMKRWIMEILVPYYIGEMKKLGLTDQQCILIIDVWSVHRSKEFLTWMAENYSWITIYFVPGGCTGIFQPCDVGIQRPFKLSLARECHFDLVKETVSQLDAGKDAVNVRWDKKIETVRNRSVGWLVTAFKSINKPELIQKVRSKYIALSNIFLTFVGI